MRLKDVRPQAGTNFVRVEFAFKARKISDNTPRDELPEIKDAFVVLDPQSKWCIRDYKLEFTTCTMYGSCEYERVAGRPVLRRLLITTDYDRNRGKSIKKCEYENVTHRAAPEAEFTLSAFGLPEPTWLAKTPTPWYWWIALAGIVCLGLASLFRWLARRARRTAAGTHA